ncbi:hypothetical protein BST61_g3963 [Cercospora zeina]
MTPQRHYQASPASVMLGLFLGFAQIGADELPGGIVPNKRQVVGTGVTSSASEPTSSEMSSSSNSAPPEETTSSAPNTNPPPPTSSQPTPSQTTEPTPTTAPAPSTSNVPTSIDITTTNSDGSTVTSRIATSTAVGPASTSSEVVELGSTTIHRSTLTSATVITAPLVTSITEQLTFTSTFSSAGSVFTSTGTTQRVIASTTGFATSTIAPSIQESGSGGGGGGLSSSSQKIIGGVVGGIGGAILVGGLALVAFRIWGKKKAQKEAAMDPFYGAGVDSQNDSVRKSSPQLAAGTGLERYQQPHNNPGVVNPGSVNTASNF